MLRKTVILLVALAAAGCGYRAGYTVRRDIDKLSVPIFKNDTFYRGLELTLTSEVLSAVEKRTPYSITDSSEADAILVGRIASYKTTVLHEDTANTAIETGLALVVEVSLEEARSGKVLYRGEIREGDSFAAAAGETEEGVRELLFRRTAMRILEAALDEDW